MRTYRIPCRVARDCSRRRVPGRPSRLSRLGALHGLLTHSGDSGSKEQESRLRPRESSRVCAAAACCRSAGGLEKLFSTAKSTRRGLCAARRQCGMNRTWWPILISLFSARCPELLPRQRGSAVVQCTLHTPNNPMLFTVRGKGGRRGPPPDLQAGSWHLPAVSGRAGSSRLDQARQRLRTSGICSRVS